MSVIVLSLAYFIGAAFVTTSQIGKMVQFPVVYRVIYVPAAFSLLTVFYARIFSARQNRAIGLAAILALGLPLHLSILLLNTFFSVIMNSADIGFFYKIYIEAVICIALLLISCWSINIIKCKFFMKEELGSDACADPFYFPLVFVFPYALYMASQHNSMQALLLFILTGLVSCIVVSGLRVQAALLNCYNRAKRLFEDRRRVLIIIFMAAFVIRLLFGVNIIHQTKSDYPTASDDGTTYDEHASGLAKSISYVRQTNFMPTQWDAGYSFILGLLYKIFGRSFYAVMIVQSLLGACVPVLAYLMAGLITQRRSVAMLSAILTSLDQPLIMFSCILGQEAVFIPLVTLIVFIVTRSAIASEERPVTAVDMILLGVSFGVAIAVRSAIIFFVPVVLAYMFFVNIKRTLIRRAADIVLVLCIIAAIIAPITYINHLNSGKYYLLTKPKSILEWDFDDGPGYYFPGNGALVEMGINPKDIKGSAASIARDPVKFIRVEGGILARRYVGFFFCYNFGFFDPIYLINAARIPNDFASNLEFYVAILVFAGFAVIMSDRDMRKRAWAAILLLAYYVLLHVIVTRMGNSRYRAPVHPYLLIFAAVGIDQLWRYIRKGSKEIE